MTKEEILMIAKGSSEFTRLQTRVYQDGKLLGYFSEYEFCFDQIDLYKEELLQKTDPLGIFYTEDNLYFGYMNLFGYFLVIGPTSELRISEKLAVDVAKKIGCNAKESMTFRENMQKLPFVPVSTIILMMCIGYHQNTGIKLDIMEMVRRNRKKLPRIVKEAKEAKKKSLFDLDEEILFDEAIFLFEGQYLHIMKAGDVEMVETLIQEFSGLLPQKESRQMKRYKTHFIQICTVASRYATSFGVPAAEAYALADSYIGRCEYLDEVGAIYDLTVRMLKNFVILVKKMRKDMDASTLMTKVENYIQTHMTEKITVEGIAHEFGMSRNSLSGKFKKETGYQLSDYIQIKKIERAKYLLSTTDSSIAQISALLSYSSQSHFQRTFKKYVNKTPNVFKKEG